MTRVRTRYTADLSLAYWFAAGAGAAFLVLAAAWRALEVVLAGAT